MKNILIALISLFICAKSQAQPSFLDYQKNFPRVAGAISNKVDTLKKQFSSKGLDWPAHEIYIRSFKYDSQMEVWVKNSNEEVFKLLKTYRVCSLAGTLGPKRMEGDYQVPEGFYCINQFKPNSNFHLSLGINYPNASDKILSDHVRPGGDIFIHGNCVTIGCIPIQDSQIEELYLIATMARNSGQDFIPVHIFPAKFDIKESMNYVNQLSKDNKKIIEFDESLKTVYDYFNKEKKLPVISVDDYGVYKILE